MIIYTFIVLYGKIMDIILKYFNEVLFFLISLTLTPGKHAKQVAQFTKMLGHKLKKKWESAYGRLEL